MTINREATIRWKGYDPDDLKPQSNKRVWANCDICGHGRWVWRHAYHDLCGSCTMLKRWLDQIERDKLVKSANKYWSDQTNRDKQSKIIKNSESAKAAAEARIGGFNLYGIMLRMTLVDLKHYEFE